MEISGSLPLPSRSSRRRRLSRGAPMSFARTWRGVVIVVVAAVLCSWQASAQIIGTDICGCQPATYTFTFDFELDCDDTSVGGDGINGTACLTEIRGQEEVPAEDLVPLSVQNVQLFELDQDLQVVAQTVRTGSFTDGSTFTYTSIISTMLDTIDPQMLPRGLQVVSTGLNSKEQSVVNSYIITYTNDCGVFPILTEGQSAGWTIFSDLGDPPTMVCPLAPSLAPTRSPTPAPMVEPTTGPPVAPTDQPEAPTDQPVAPTDRPVAPTDVPAPTDRPTPPKTRPPACPPKPSGKGKGGSSSKSVSKRSKAMKKSQSKSKGMMSMQKLGMMRESSSSDSRSGKGYSRHLGTGQRPSEQDECYDYDHSDDVEGSTMDSSKNGGKGKGGMAAKKKKRDSDMSMKGSMLSKPSTGKGSTDSDSRSRRGKGTRVR